MKLLNANNEIAIFTIMLNLYYNEKIIYEVNHNVIVIV